MDYKIALMDLMKQKSYVDQPRELIMIKNMNIYLVHNRGGEPFSGQVSKFEIKFWSAKNDFLLGKIKEKAYIHVLDALLNFSQRATSGMCAIGSLHLIYNYHIIISIDILHIKI